MKKHPTKQWFEFIKNIFSKVADQLLADRKLVFFFHIKSYEEFEGKLESWTLERLDEVFKIPNLKILPLLEVFENLWILDSSVLDLEKENWEFNFMVFKKAILLTNIKNKLISNWFDEFLIGSIIENLRDNRFKYYLEYFLYNLVVKNDDKILFYWNKKWEAFLINKKSLFKFFSNKIEEWITFSCDIWSDKILNLSREDYFEWSEKKIITELFSEDFKEVKIKKSKWEFSEIEKELIFHNVKDFNEIEAKVPWDLEITTMRRKWAKLSTVKARKRISLKSY